MKKLILGLIFIISTSSFASDCSLSLVKGANYGSINEGFIPFEDIENELQRLAEKEDYTLVADGTAAVEARISSVVYMTNKYSVLKQVDIYTEDSSGSILIDVYSRGGLINKSPKSITFKALKKLVKELPKCEL